MAPSGMAFARNCGEVHDEVAPSWKGSKMNWPYSFKKEKNLLLSFGTVLLLTFAIEVGCGLFIRGVNRSAIELADKWTPSVQALMSLRTGIGELRSLQLMHILSHDEVAMADYEARIKTRLETTKNEEDRYQKLISSDEELHLFQLEREHWLLFLDDHQNLISLSRHNLKDNASEVASGSSANGMETVIGLINQLVQVNIDGGKQARKEVDSAFTAASATLGVLSALSVVASMGFSVWMVRSASVRQDRQYALADALLAASRHTIVRLHFGKGLAGAPSDELAAPPLRSPTNPAVAEAFARIGIQKVQALRGDEAATRIAELRPVHRHHPEYQRSSDRHGER